MSEHDLKTLPEYFAYLWSGDKTFELRKDDRGYWVGDTLLLREWSSAKGYSGRQIRAEVTFVLSGLPWLHKDMVCMSIKEDGDDVPRKNIALRRAHDNLVLVKDAMTKWAADLAEIADRVKGPRCGAAIELRTIADAMLRNAERLSPAEKGEE